MLTILIVEDHTNIRENILEILGMEGYYAIGAENGEVGFELAKNKKPDMIICDTHMPVMNGRELLHKLKMHPATSDIPLVFTVFNTDKKEMQEGLNSGAVAYLPKPFEARELLRLVERILT